MGYMIEITENKLEKIGEYVEDMLWAGGELMHCIEKMKEGHHGMGERGGRYSMGSRMNYREHDDWDDEREHDDMMERRRRRDSRGRYM